MGQIADDMINGASCCLCGVYFMDENDEVYEHGYPVVCRACWSSLTKDEKQLYTKCNSDAKEL